MIKTPKNLILAIGFFALLSTFSVSSLFAQSFHTGLDAYQRGEYQSAFEIWKPFAEQGFAPAQANLGWMYDNGLGTTEDDQQAVHWYQLAAEQGDVSAQANLGWMYSEGLGVDQDHSVAAHWYYQAARRGNASAQHNLGWIYETGLGVTQSQSDAKVWYRLASKQGLVAATDSLRRLGEVVTSEDQLAGMDSKTTGNSAIEIIQRPSKSTSHKATTGSTQQSISSVTAVDKKPKTTTKVALQPIVSKSTQQTTSSNLQYMESKSTASGMETVPASAIPAVPIVISGQETISSTEAVAQKEANTAEKDAEKQDGDEPKITMDLKDPNVQYQIGKRHMIGKGTPVNYIQAYVWFRLAANQGHPSAVRRLEVLETIISTTEIARAEKLAAKQGL